MRFPEKVWLPKQYSCGLISLELQQRCVVLGEFHRQGPRTNAETEVCERWNGILRDKCWAAGGSTKWYIPERHRWVKRASGDSYSICLTCDLCDRTDRFVAAADKSSSADGVLFVCESDCLQTCCDSRRARGYIRSTLLLLFWDLSSVA